jgi:hypothetical protein
MRAPENGALRVPAETTKSILPDAEGVFDAIARIGYEFEHAIADLVDNSVDATKSPNVANVLVRFVYDDQAVRSVAIIDDGEGMDDRRIDEAMAFGARTGKGDDSLGKYGMGLKSASFSQCDVLTVISRRRGRVVGRRWTAEKARADWTCEVLLPDAAETYLEVNSDRIGTRPHGTLVEWNRLDALSHSMQKPERMIQTRFEQLSSHLGLVFHRFLENGTLRIRLDAVNPLTGARGIAQDVTALNPFPAVSGYKGYPRLFTFRVPDGPELSFTAHIWRRDATQAGFRLGGGRLSKRQGIYVYRNGRVIQAGGWNGLRNDAEVHSSLARVEFDLPASLDAVFKPTVQKSAVSMPEEMLHAMKTAESGPKRFSDFLADAETAYREQKPGKAVRNGLVPVSGMNRPLAGRFQRILGEPRGDEDVVAFVWEPMEPDTFFEVEPDTNTIILNSRYREAVLQGTRGSSGDAPLVKTLLMLLCKDDMTRRNRMQTHEVKLQTFNQLLVEAVRSQW